MPQCPTALSFSLTSFVAMARGSAAICSLKRACKDRIGSTLVRRPFSHHNHILHQIACSKMQKGPHSTGDLEKGLIAVKATISFCRCRPPAQSSTTRSSALTASSAITLRTLRMFRFGLKRALHESVDVRNWAMHPTRHRPRRSSIQSQWAFLDRLVQALNSCNLAESENPGRTGGSVAS